MLSRKTFPVVQMESEVALVEPVPFVNRALQNINKLPIRLSHNIIIAIGIFLPYAIYDLNATPMSYYLPYLRFECNVNECRITSFMPSAF